MVEKHSGNNDVEHTRLDVLPGQLNTPNITVPTKSEYLKSIFDDGDLLKRVDPALKLLMRLILHHEGRFVGSYEDLTAPLGAKASTIGTWAKKLHEEGFAHLTVKGHKVEITLANRFMDMAKAPNHRVVERDAEPAEDDDPRVAACRNMAKEAVNCGGTITLTITLP